MNNFQDKGFKMTDKEISEQFENIMQPKIINQVINTPRPPAKFPELRWIAGVAGIASFTFMIICSSIAVLLESM